MPSTLLKRVDVESLPEDIRDAYEKSLDLRGDATFFEVFANHPELYRWYTESFYAKIFRAGKVERRIKELVRLRLSTEHGCRFCNQGNRVDALEAGLSASDIEHIDARSTSHFSAREQAALALADQLVLTKQNGQLDDALYARLKQHFDDAQILELGLVLGMLSGVAKFLFAFDLVEKEDHCPLHSEQIAPQ